MMNMISKLALGGIAALAISGSAMAADLSIPARAPAPVAAPAGGWDGAYIGGNVGYGSGNSDHNDIVTTIGDFGMTGWFVGGQIGYNFHLTDGVVLGVQGDLEWANITGTDPTFTNIQDTINWTGAVTARIGYDAGQFMPYLLGGIAVANSTRQDISGVTTESQNHTGWTVGAGVEGMITDSLSAFAEYRYSDYGTATYSNLISTPGVGLTAHSVRAGLNFHF
jgi:outer membrane immunogenic protein